MLKKFGDFRVAFRLIRTGCHQYGVSLPKGLLAALRLYTRDQFSLKEIVGYALYVPEIRSSMPVLISKESSLAMLARMNPTAKQAQTENKAIFYRHCQEAGLPVPETYGAFRQGIGTDRFGAPLDGKTPWTAYFNENLPSHFIIKDVGGAYASGFGAFERRDNHYVEVGGNTYDSSSFFDELTRRSASEIVIQERLFDHPDLQALCGHAGLQTMRVNTQMHSDGTVSMLFHMLKVLVSGNIGDNFSMGTTGNLIAVSQAGNDILSGARALHPCGSGLITIKEHPETGVSFDGFQIPMWQEAIDLAKTAHRSFGSFGSLGWDIAITTDGPKLIEANAWWDPPNYAPTIMADDNWRKIFA